MTRLSDEEVSRIARRLAERWDAAPPPPASASSLPARAAPGNPQSAPTTRAGAGAPRLTALRPSAAEDRLSPGGGLFGTLDEAVSAARRAFGELSRASLETRRRIIERLRSGLADEIENLSRSAVDETGLGRFEDKVIKNRLVIRKTPGTEFLSPRALSGDRGLTLMEPAPYGVIGAITPVTNPTATIICNSIGMLAAGNGVVFNGHPSAKRCSGLAVQLINRFIAEAGGPPNLVTAVADPSIESAQALMRHPDVRLLVVTGGAGVVAEAMRSGKRAICAGPGNPPVVVDETADIEQAGRDIVAGASFDNNIICTDEKEVFVVAAVADALLAAMRAHGAYVLNHAELRNLERVIFDQEAGPGRSAVVAKDLIGKDAAVILGRAGIRVHEGTRLAVADVPADHPLVWTEQMMPVLPVVRVADAEAAIDLAIRAEHGFGHSAGMYSKHLDRLSRMAREINTSIFVKNGPLYSGLGEGGEGYSSFSIASPTGEGLTGPHSFSRQRRCVLVDHFRIV